MGFGAFRLLGFWGFRVILGYWAVGASGLLGFSAFGAFRVLGFWACGLVGFRLLGLRAFGLLGFRVWAVGFIGFRVLLQFLFFQGLGFGILGKGAGSNKPD